MVFSDEQDQEGAAPQSSGADEVGGYGALLGEPFALTPSLRLRNRFVATAHGRAAVQNGVPSATDADYWKRLASGGAGMCIAGGTAIAPHSTYRTRNLTEAWRPESVAGLAMRAAAMRAGGAAAVLQILHLGRETLGAETYYHPVGPSAVRSPRESTAPRPLAEEELDEILEGFRLAALHAVEAGFDGIELHAAHGYLLGQFLSPAANRRPGAETVAGRLELLTRIVRTIRSAAPHTAIGVRMSVGDQDDTGLDVKGLEEVLRALDRGVDYVNLTVGMRADYVRDMATTRPPLLDHVSQLRQATDRPLLLSHGFRDVTTMLAARAAGADLVGMARALIADPDLPKKVLAGRPREVRPCVACIEDCRAFDPTLLCSVNPDLAAPGDDVRRAAPLLRGTLRPSPGRVAIIGAGPAGLEAALTLQHAGTDVVMFEQEEAIGGTIGLVGTAPARSGWRRIVDYYRYNLDPARIELRLGDCAEPDDVTEFDAVVIATGAQEAAPTGAATSVTDAIAGGTSGLAGVSHLVVVDDGFGWWPAVNALELGIAAGVDRITIVTPSMAFATGIPAESRVQLLKRLHGAVRLDVRPMTLAIGEDVVRSLTSGDEEHLEADAVIVVGERRPRDWSGFERESGLVVIGDALVPRRVAHAISEGRAAATLLRGHPANARVVARA